jgi:hypothetical protein
MLADRLTPSISAALAQDVSLRNLGEREAQVKVPFYLPDGDGLAIYVRQVGDTFEITDKAYTLQNLSYHVDIDRLEDGPRAALFEKIRARHAVEDREGELVTTAASTSDVGRAVFNFVHALLQVADLRFLEREIVRSTFRHDFEHLVSEHFPAAVKDYTDPEHDRDGKYPVDFLLNGVARPIAVFGVQTEAAALKAVVTAEKFLSWERPMRFVAVEEDQEKALSRRTVAWLSDTFDKQFSSLASNRREIAEYLDEELRVSRLLSNRDVPS